MRTDDPEAHVKRLKRQMVRSLAVPTYRAAQAESGREPLLAPVYEAWDRGDRHAAEHMLPDEVVTDLAVVGDPSSCARRLLEYRAAGVDHIAVAAGAASGEEGEILDLLEALMGAWRLANGGGLAR